MGQIRLAVRAVIVSDGRLLLVNAFPGGRGNLWCAPGGGMEAGQSLTANLEREVLEETGLAITTGPLIHVSEFADMTGDFHQVELYFRARVDPGATPPTDWRDPAGNVVRHVRATEVECATLDLSPPTLIAIAFGSPPQLEPGPLLHMRR